MESQARLDHCATLKVEIAALRQEINVTEEVITGRRHEDQVEAYLAVMLFSPAMLLIDQQRAQKKVLDEKQKQIDLKLAEQHALQCP